MRTFILITSVAIGTVCSTGRIAAQGTIYEFPISIAPSSSQLSTHEVIFSPNGPVKTVWDSGNVSVGPKALYSGDTVVFDFALSSLLLASDLASNSDTNEMIYWFVSGSGPLTTSLTMQYEWQFLSTSGALLASNIFGYGVLRPIPGQLQGVINASQTFSELNLTDSSFAFGGLRLTLTVPNMPSFWVINGVRMDFASDNVQIVPEPTAKSLAGLCGTIVVFMRCWQRRSSKLKI
jgi:hypothetical protein